jgi:hypothetical protein
VDFAELEGKLDEEGTTLDREVTASWVDMKPVEDMVVCQTAFAILNSFEEFIRLAFYLRPYQQQIISTVI